MRVLDGCYFLILVVLLSKSRIIFKWFLSWCCVLSLLILNVVTIFEKYVNGILRELIAFILILINLCLCDFFIFLFIKY